ncbi:VOC family protein [Paracoccus onubensis]|uniref:VOC family protein n=1 Tax=Paracoccus onubensis TaxID=1675788 RepID=UPI001C7241B1|nr:VOC family protein [Paracoccus onubensis]
MRVLLSGKPGALQKGFASAVFYQDAKAAYRWLENAFGFEPLFVILDADGYLGHSEMTYGNSVVMIGNEWSDNHKSPKSVGGKNTQCVHVQLAEGDDLDAHCAHARQAGAEILQEPETQFYGDRTYRARDPEGHIWTFGVTVQKMTPEEWDEASGLTTRARLD